MSGCRWLSPLLITLSLSATGCQVDGGRTSVWNPFVRAEKANAIDEETLPKFVRRLSDEKADESERSEVPIAESRVEALLADGQRALQENRIPDAQRSYGEVLQFLPDNATAHHGLAMAADLTEQWTEAENHYRQALRSRPRDANLLCDIGYSYLLQNRYSEASSYLSQAIQINPNHENAHGNLAMLDLRQGNREAARKRIQQRFGNTAKATQVLAALEAQSTAKAATSLAATAAEIPANASFEDVRELARRERIVAEQRRAELTAPDRFHDVAPPSNHNLTASVGPETPGPSIHQPTPQNPQFGGSITAPAWNVQTSAGIVAATQPMGQFGLPASGMNIQGYSPPPASGSNLALNSGNLQEPAANHGFSPAAASVQGSGGVIPVHPSGSFQPPNQSVSYGQPMGFGQRPIETASFQNQKTGPPVENAAYGYGAGSQQSNWPAQQNQYPGQNVSHLQLDGLNAGPGALFPIGQYPTGQYPNMTGIGQNSTQPESMNSPMNASNPYASGQYPNSPPPMSGFQPNVGPQDGSLRMGNMSAPGTNSMINGAMYGQPVSTLPSQEWMMQQQQQFQQWQQQQSQTAGQGNPYPGQNGSDSQGSRFGNADPTTAPRPGVQAPAVNSLGSYENQLRQLDNQYNTTLQQMDRNSTVIIPRAQY